MTDRTSTQKISKDKEDLNNIINQTDLTFIKHSTNQQQNIHSFQEYMKYLPRQTIYLAKNKSWYRGKKKKVLLKFEIINRKILGKFLNIWKLNGKVIDPTHIHGSKSSQEKF